MQSNKQLVVLVISLFFILHLILTFRLQYTTDDGDSIYHYLYSRWAFKHPENFVDHWAKPFFVLLSAPFAQFGFKAISIFNLFAMTGALIYTHHFCTKIHIGYSFIPVSLMSVFVFSNQIVHSGLTEPLGCLIMIAGMYYLVSYRLSLGLILLSFLPFVRSEGLIICAAVVIWLIYTKQPKWIPLLTVGHIFYSILGAAFSGKPLLWIFTEIPYPAGDITYGSGHWYHYIYYMPRTIGKLPAALWVCGLVLASVMLFSKEKVILMNSFQKKTFWTLVVMCFTFFFGFHAISWALGMFKSFGLLRVMVVLFPQIAIICSLPIIYLIHVIEKNGRQIRPVYFLLLILICNFFDLEYGFLNKNQFSLMSSQKLVTNASNYVKANYNNYTLRKYVFSATYFAMLFKLDIFNKQQTINFSDYSQNKNFATKGTLFLWDEWYSTVENNTKAEMLLADSTLALVKTFTDLGYEGRNRKIILFEKR